jgi:hypothetical protein
MGRDRISRQPARGWIGFDFGARRTTARWTGERKLLFGKELEFLKNLSGGFVQLWRFFDRVAPGRREDGASIPLVAARLLRRWSVGLYARVKERH